MTTEESERNLLVENWLQAWAQICLSNQWGLVTSAPRIGPTMVVVLLSHLSFHQGLIWHVFSMWLVPHPKQQDSPAPSGWLHPTMMLLFQKAPGLCWESFLSLSWKQPHCMLQTESWVTRVLVLTPHSQCDGICRDFAGSLLMIFCLLWIGCWVYDSSVAPAWVSWDIVMLLADHRHHLLSIDLSVFRHHWQLPWI